jgi:flagellar secretion chaperone FliS
LRTAYRKQHQEDAMTLHLARQSYRRAEQATPQVPDDAHAVIGVALTEVQKALEVLAAAAKAGHALPSAAMTRALSAIYLLQSSLDFDNGGDIAPALFQVYEHCRLQLVEAFQNPAAGAAGLQQAAEFITTLRAAWDEMPRPA